MSKDTIYREDAIKVIKDNSFAPGVDYLEINGYGAIDDIRALPSADRPQGEWIERESYAEDKEDGFETTIVCSCCDFPATIFNFEDGESRTQVRTDFCPNCGADMRGEQDE